MGFILASIVSLIFLIHTIVNLPSCPKYNCATSSNCASIANYTNGKNITLSPCSNQTTHECRITDNIVQVYDRLNVTCTSKSSPPMSRR